MNIDNILKEVKRIKEDLKKNPTNLESAIAKINKLLSSIVTTPEKSKWEKLIDASKTAKKTVCESLQTIPRIRIILKPLPKKRGRPSK